MTDRIDTDAIRRRITALSRAQTVALCDEVDRLRLDLRSEQMERADAERERDTLVEALRTARGALDVFAAADTKWISGFAREALARLDEPVTE